MFFHPVCQSDCTAVCCNDGGNALSVHILQALDTAVILHNQIHEEIVVRIGYQEGFLSCRCTEFAAGIQIVFSAGGSCQSGLIIQYGIIEGPVIQIIVDEFQYLIFISCRFPVVILIGIRSVLCFQNDFCCFYVISACCHSEYCCCCCDNCQSTYQIFFHKFSPLLNHTVPIDLVLLYFFSVCCQ